MSRDAAPARQAVPAARAWALWRLLGAGLAAGWPLAGIAHDESVGGMPPGPGGQPVRFFLAQASGASGSTVPAGQDDAARPADSPDAAGPTGSVSPAGAPGTGGAAGPASAGDAGAKASPDAAGNAGSYAAGDAGSDDGRALRRAADVDVSGPQPAREAIERALRGWQADVPPRDAFGTQRAVSEARRIATEALATEGWFSPQLRVEDDGRRVRIEVEPGARTTIEAVEIEFSGAIADEAGAARRRALREAWSLARGAPFRQDDWAAAKRRLLDAVLAQDFASARLVDSRATVDADAARARLRVAIDSGPRFTFGALRVEGLSSYDRALVERYVRIRPGDPYSAEALLALQTALQNTPYFGSVAIEIDRDPAAARGVPILVRVTETMPRAVGFGVGYSSNTGARGELTYRNIDFLDRAWSLESGVRIEQLRQLGFATMTLPPNRDASRDAFTLLGERSDIQNLTLRRVEAIATRSRVRGPYETRLSVNLLREERSVPAAPDRIANALTLNWSWTWRDVDDLIDPRRGVLVNAQVGGGTRALLSDQNFLRGFVRAQRFWPVGARDVFSVRATLGATLAPSREGIPQTFLFRTGGSTTVRGYGFESLGVREAGAVVGGRYTASAGAEYVNWFAERWGAAAFVDAGNAVDRPADWRAALGYGLGMRFRSPVGPLALDVAYGQDARRLRLHVAIAVAF